MYLPGSEIKRLDPLKFSLLSRGKEFILSAPDEIEVGGWFNAITYAIDKAIKFTVRQRLFAASNHFRISKLTAPG